MGIGYRPFRNFDSPALVAIWNQAVTGRGAAFLHSTAVLENYVLAKPYFDPEGLIVAEEDGEVVGFSHGGFGPAAGGLRLTTDAGVICALVVARAHRRRGIGTELLHRAEAYLQNKGAQAVYFGAMRPLNPFYLGLYGGSELPGVLTSEVHAEPFLLARGYTVWDRCIVLNRALDSAPAVADARFPAIRHQYRLHALLRPASTRLYEEWVLSPLETLQFELKDKSSGVWVGRAITWEMDLFSWRWHQATAGIMDVEVHEGYRRQGLGKFLVAQILECLYREQFFARVEVQTMQRNLAALSLYEGLGFQRVDEGRVYRLR